MQPTENLMNYTEVRFTENSLQTTKKKSLSLLLIDYIMIRELLVSYFVVFVFLRLKHVCIKKAIAFLWQSKEQINTLYNR